MPTLPPSPRPRLRVARRSCVRRLRRRAGRQSGNLCVATQYPNLRCWPLAPRLSYPQAKTTKKIVLRLQCSECKGNSMKPIKVRWGHALPRAEAGSLSVMRQQPVPGQVPQQAQQAQLLFCVSSCAFFCGGSGTKQQHHHHQQQQHQCLQNAATVHQGKVASYSMLHAAALTHPRTHFSPPCAALQALRDRR